MNTDNYTVDKEILESLLDRWDAILVIREENHDKVLEAQERYKLKCRELTDHNTRERLRKRADALELSVIRTQKHEILTSSVVNYLRIILDCIEDLEEYEQDLEQDNLPCD